MLVRFLQTVLQNFPTPDPHTITDPFNHEAERYADYAQDKHDDLARSTKSRFNYHADNDPADAAREHPSEGEIRTRQVLYLFPPRAMQCFAFLSHEFSGVTR